MPEKKDNEIMKQIATRVPESIYDQIEKDCKEKGFRSKSDYVANAVEVYIKGDTSTTSDTTYIPKSRVTAQYQNLLARINELESKLSEKDEQLQLITALNFIVTFKATRPSRFRLSKEEVDNILQEVSQLADSAEGIKASDLQNFARQIISNDLPLKTNVNASNASANPQRPPEENAHSKTSNIFYPMTVRTFDENKLLQDICIDAWKEYKNTYHSPAEKIFLMREIVYFENSYLDPDMLDMEDEGNTGRGTERGRAYCIGRLAVENDIWFKAYHKKSGYLEPNVTPEEYLNEWSVSDGRFIIPFRYRR